MDLPKAVLSSLAQYADDSSLFKAINNENDVRDLQGDLDSIQNWCTNNGMILNASKSIHFKITKSNNSINLEYSINNNVIPAQSNIKCLGVNITDDLKWNNHVNIAVAKSFKILGMLRRSLTGTRRAALRMAYLTLVRPVLLYGTPAWHPVTAQNLKKLDKVQNSATRLILGKSSFHYVNGVKHKHNGKNRNKMCKIPSVSDVLYRQDVVFLHKCILGDIDLPVFSNTRISLRSKPSMLRGGDSIKYVVPFIPAAYYNTSFFPRSVKLYNMLNDSVRNLSSAQFKTKI
jgi:hypothetical protein